MNTQTKIIAGDTVVCIDASEMYKYLTEGYTYKVIKAGELSCWVRANDRVLRAFSLDRFKIKQSRDGLSLKDCFIGKIVLAKWGEFEIVHITGLSKNSLGEVIVTVRRPDDSKDVQIHPANLFELE
jgi:hypothetical protein